MESFIKEVIDEAKPIYIFGAGIIGKQAALCLKEEHSIAVEGFFDNDWTLWGKRIVGECYCEEPSLHEAICIVAVSDRNVESVRCDAQRIGYHKILIWNPEWGKCYDPKYIELLNKRTPRKRLYYVVDLVEHCNLNCQMCDHFAPLSDEHFMSIDTYKRDILRIKELFGECVSLICLEGGEPLLHPQISEAIRHTHHLLPHTSIYVFTTGLLLEKMDLEFWKACRETNTVLSVTKYPIGYDYSRMEELCRKERVALRYFSGDKTVKTSIHKPIDLNANQNKYDSFNRCHMSNGDCVDLKEGKLFPCTFAANVHIFNKHFDKDIQISDKDYIDIYSDTTPEEIMEFLCNPIPACRYCDVRNTSFGHEWRTSSRMIEEWI